MIEAGTEAVEDPMPTCRHCGFDLDREAERCPLCGTPVHPEGRGVGDGREGPPPSPAAAPAWEDPGAPFPGNAWDTWRRSVLEPGAFFAGVPWDRSLGRPVLYYLLVSISAGFFTLWWESLGWAPSFPMPPGSDGGGGGGALALVDFFLTPFFALLALGIGSLVLHFFALLLAPERRGYGATVRVLCYAAGPVLFTIVPFLGPLVAWVWSLVLHVIGMREAHRTTTGRAAAIVLLPWVLFLALVALAVMVLVALAGLTLFERGA